MSRIASILALSAALLCPAQPTFADPEWDELQSAYEKAHEEYMKKMDNGDGMIHFDHSTPMPDDGFRPQYRAYTEKHAGESVHANDPSRTRTLPTAERQSFHHPRDLPPPMMPLVMLFRRHS